MRQFSSDDFEFPRSKDLSNLCPKGSAAPIEEYKGHQTKYSFWTEPEQTNLKIVFPSSPSPLRLFPTLQYTPFILDNIVLVGILKHQAIFSSKKKVTSLSFQ